MAEAVLEFLREQVAACVWVTIVAPFAARALVALGIEGTQGTGWVRFVPRAPKNLEPKKRRTDYPRPNSIGEELLLVFGAEIIAFMIAGPVVAAVGRLVPLLLWPALAAASSGASFVWGIRRARENHARTMQFLVQRLAEDAAAQNGGSSAV